MTSNVINKSRLGNQQQQLKVDSRKIDLFFEFVCRIPEIFWIGVVGCATDGEVMFP